MRSVPTIRASSAALPILSLMLMAASPLPRTYDLRFSTVAPSLSIPTAPVASRAAKPDYDIAPTPNRDVAAPNTTSASNSAYLAPSLFTRGQQNRGEGFLSGSSAQAEQDRRAMPGAGFNLTMPLQK